MNDKSDIFETLSEIFKPSEIIAILDNKLITEAQKLDSEQWPYINELIKKAALKETKKALKVIKLKLYYKDLQFSGLL